MSNKPFITYHLNTFNRLDSLKIMLESFEECNQYANFEWVFVDLGSTDGTQEFLFDKYKNCGYASLVLGNENKYKDILENKGLGALNERMRFAIFGWAKNMARSVGKGDYFIEIADDHKFIKKGDWVSDMMEVFEHRKSMNDGVCDISSIIYRGMPHWRLFKPNNARGPEQTTDSGISYFTSDIKGYDDYHMIKRSTYEEIGPYLEVDRLPRTESLEADQEKIKQWKDRAQKPVTPDCPSAFCQYTDYIERCNKVGYQKAYLKIPYAVDTEYLKPKTPDIYFKDDELEIQFKDLDRPVSTEEINAYQFQK